MGLEWRKGHRYYYQKERIGDRVVSRYMGGGELALLMAEIDTRARAQEADRQLRARKTIQKWQERHDDDDAFLDDLEESLRTLTDAVLLVNGYHTHKRQWRKQRKRRS